MVGQVFEGVLVNITLVGRDGTPVTLTLSNDGDTPAVAEGSRLDVHFAPAHASVLPKAGSAHA